MTFWKRNKKWIEIALWVIIPGTLYLTGYHVEVIGGAQRILLMTGIMQPEVQEQEPVEQFPQADFSLSLTDLDGNRVNLADMKGKVIFLNFWATWCPPCIAELPGIEKLQKDMASDDVVFVLVNTDMEKEKMDAFLKRKEYNDLPVYRPYPSTHRIPESYRMGAIPTTIVIDKSGRIRLTQKGMADFDTEEFRNFLNDLSSES